MKHIKGEALIKAAGGDVYKMGYARKSDFFKPFSNITRLIQNLLLSYKTCGFWFGVIILLCYGIEIDNTAWKTILSSLIIGVVSSTIVSLDFARTQQSQELAKSLSVLGRKYQDTFNQLEALLYWRMYIKNVEKTNTATINEITLRIENLKNGIINNLEACQHEVQKIWHTQTFENLLPSETKKFRKLFHILMDINVDMSNLNYYANMTTEPNILLDLHVLLQTLKINNKCYAFSQECWITMICGEDFDNIKYKADDFFRSISILKRYFNLLNKT